MLSNAWQTSKCSDPGHHGYRKGVSRLSFQQYFAAAKQMLSGRVDGMSLHALPEGSMTLAIGFSLLEIFKHVLRRVHISQLRQGGAERRNVTLGLQQSVEDIRNSWSMLEPGTPRSA